MTQLSTFFEHSGTALGSVFYPKHFIFATFPMRTLSRYVFGSEAKFADADIEWAKAAGFVIVHCSTQAESLRIGQIVSPFSPASIQWYRSLVMESLV